MLEDSRPHYTAMSRADGCQRAIGKCGARQRQSFGGEQSRVCQVAEVGVGFAFIDGVSNGAKEVHKIFAFAHLLSNDADASAAALSGFNDISPFGSKS